MANVYVSESQVDRRELWVVDTDNPERTDKVTEPSGFVWDYGNAVGNLPNDKIYGMVRQPAHEGGWLWAIDQGGTAYRLNPTDLGDRGPILITNPADPSGPKIPYTIPHPGDPSTLVEINYGTVLRLQGGSALDLSDVFRSQFPDGYGFAGIWALTRLSNNDLIVCALMQRTINFAVTTYHTFFRLRYDVPEDLSGEYGELLTFNSETYGPSMYGMTVDRDDRVYVIESEGSQLYRFEPNSAASDLNWTRVGLLPKDPPNDSVSHMRYEALTQESDTSFTIYRSSVSTGVTDRIYRFDIVDDIDDDGNISVHYIGLLNTGIRYADEATLVSAFALSHAPAATAQIYSASLLTVAAEVDFEPSAIDAGLYVSFYQSADKTLYDPDAEPGDRRLLLVNVHDPDSYNAPFGAWVTTIPDGVDEISDITVDLNHDLIIADNNNREFYRMPTSHSSGPDTVTYGKIGDYPTDLTTRVGLTIDGDGNLITVDSGNILAYAVWRININNTTSTAGDYGLIGILPRTGTVPWVSLIDVNMDWWGRLMVLDNSGIWLVWLDELNMTGAPSNPGGTTRTGLLRSLPIDYGVSLVTMPNSDAVVIDTRSSGSNLYRFRLPNPPSADASPNDVNLGQISHDPGYSTGLAWPGARLQPINVAPVEMSFPNYINPAVIIVSVRHWDVDEAIHVTATIPLALSVKVSAVGTQALHSITAKGSLKFPNYVDPADVLAHVRHWDVDEMFHIDVELIRPSVSASFDIVDFVYAEANLVLKDQGFKVTADVDHHQYEHGIQAKVSLSIPSVKADVTHTHVTHGITAQPILPLALSVFAAVTSEAPPRLVRGVVNLNPSTLYVFVMLEGRDTHINMVVHLIGWLGVQATLTGEKWVPHLIIPKPLWIGRTGPLPRTPELEVGREKRMKALTDRMPYRLVVIPNPLYDEERELPDDEPNDAQMLLNQLWEAYVDGSATVLRGDYSRSHTRAQAGGRTTVDDPDSAYDFVTPGYVPYQVKSTDIGLIVEDESQGVYTIQNISYDRLLYIAHLSLVLHANRRLYN